MLTDLLSSQDIFSTPDLKTKMSILHAVDRSLDRMTISEICKKASISRQTFYRHFRSKYDIPWWFCIFCRQFYLNEIGRTISWQTGYYHHIRFAIDGAGVLQEVYSVQHQYAFWPDGYAAKSANSAA